MRLVTAEELLQPLMLTEDDPKPLYVAPVPPRRPWHSLEMVSTTMKWGLAWDEIGWHFEFSGNSQLTHAKDGFWAEGQHPPYRSMGMLLRVFSKPKSSLFLPGG